MAGLKKAANIQVIRKRAVSSEPLPQVQPTAEPASSAWNLLLDLARQRLNQFVALEAKVLRGDDSEAIHDFRVASRRLDQILAVLFFKPRPKKMRKLFRVARRSRRIVSETRNCDVLMRQAEKAVARKQGSDPASWKAFNDYLEQRRAKNFRDAAAKLSDLNLSSFYVRLLDSLNAWAQSLTVSPPNASSPEPQAAITAANEDLKNHIAGVLHDRWESFSARVAAAQQEEEPRSLHAVRIAAKRLRYLIEVIRDVNAADASEVLPWLRLVQKHLGDWHDADVMDETMAEMLARPRFLRNNLELAIKIERLMLKNQRARSAYEKRYVGATVNSAGWSRLEKWVTELPTKASLPSANQ